MADEDAQYYGQRAGNGTSTCESAEKADVAAIHAALARQYKAVVDREDLRPVLRISFPPTFAREAEKASRS